MGWDKGGGGSQQYSFAPPSSSIDSNALVEPMMNFMAQQMATTQEIVNNSNMAMLSLPDPSTSVEVDYVSKNKELQDRISKQISDEDIKRRGVLGTILTDIDDEDEPPAHKSSLLWGE